MNIAVILAGALLGSTTSSLLPPLQRAISYRMNWFLPNEILGVAESLEMGLRENWNIGDVTENLKAFGLAPDKTDALMKLRERLIDLFDLIALYRRDEIDIMTLLKRAGWLGWQPADVSLMLKRTEFVPNVQDIIRFAVREVYSPDIAARFGQFEGSAEVSQAAKKDLEAIGMTPEVLAKYWAAHWELPSPQMGFEMLHRDVINESDLDMLLKALDVMPFWRERMKQISYNPLTRVDVRRMHKLGVIDNNDLIRAYKDIGYNDENAQRLADFTILYNESPEEAEQTDKDKEKAKERDLTKSDILGGYEDGIYDDTDAREALSIIGYNDDEITYLLARVDYAQDRDAIKEYIKYYKTAYVNNIMPYNEVIDRLNKLNLSGKRQEMLFMLWDIEKQLKANRPTKSEILTFLRKGIIDRATAMSELSGLGYNGTYINWYLASAVPVEEESE